MSLSPEDRVLESTTTTGTGALSLAGAVTGFRQFSAVCGEDDLKPCFIEAVDSNNVPTGTWQSGLYRFSSGTLTLEEFYESSTGSPISWAAGTKLVGVGQLAYLTNTYGRSWALARGFALP